MTYLSLNATESDYIPSLVGLGHINILVMTSTQDFNAIWSQEKDLTFAMPELELSVTGVTRVNEIAKLTVSMTNPLSFTLEECSLSLEMQGNIPFRSIALENIEPHERFTQDIEFDLKNEGSYMIVAIFNSKVIRNIVSTLTVEVAG